MRARHEGRPLTEQSMLHVFRNTPLGRETLMISADFARQCGLELKVYIPRHDQFLMYLEGAIATVELDSAFLRSPATARDHAEEILQSTGCDYVFLEPERFTTRQLPDLPTDVAYMCCPRSISDVSTRISLGHIGPPVRKIIRNAPFPVLLPPSVARSWRSVVCCYDGSPNATLALRYAADIAARSLSPLALFSHIGSGDRPSIDRRLRHDGFRQAVGATPILREGGEFREHLYDIPHDALVVIGASGRGLARELLFGSHVEVVQSVLPNQLLVVGPKARKIKARHRLRPAAATHGSRGAHGPRPLTSAT